MFRATGSVQKFDGFLKIYQEGRDEKADDDDEEKTLPQVEKGEQLKLNSLTPEQHFTEPPPRYTEATLVKALEEKGIGRPSTYAAIMTTIQEREYIDRLEGRFHPTPLGTTVNDMLVQNFDDIFNTAYTAQMEERLDEIEEGKLNWRNAMQRFYDKFSVDLEKATENIKNVKKQAIPTDEICEKCGAGMVIKFGRFGKFLACSNYPECQTTREVGSKKVDAETRGEGDAENKSENSEAEVQPCENCGKPMALKKGRFGSFYGCTGYPECKNIRKIAKSGEVKTVAPPVEIDEKCPTCGKNLAIRQGRYGEFTACSDYPKCKYIKRETTGITCQKCGKGEILPKKSRRGKVFYGCSNYPKCDEVYWDKPVSETCPNCKAPYLFEKTTKKDGTVKYCNKEGCDYKVALDSTIQITETEKAETSAS
jgi:DNA topoisomerase-1